MAAFADGDLAFGGIDSVSLAWAGMGLVLKGTREGIGLWSNSFDLEAPWRRSRLISPEPVHGRAGRHDVGRHRFEREGIRRAMTGSKAAKVVVTQHGPYVVSGNVPVGVEVIVPNREGYSWDWEEGRGFEASAEYALCRSGQSAHKPFCDGTHAKIGFDGTETASRAPYTEQAKTFDGPTMVLRDAESLCAFARFCDPGGKIWGLISKTEGETERNLVTREAGHCPSGRLVVRDKKSGVIPEPKLPKSIGIVEDPALKVSGPLWVHGGIPVESEDGRRYEVRNRVTLCRCGASSNKPFCDGSHASIKFRDGLLKA